MADAKEHSNDEEAIKRSISNSSSTDAEIRGKCNKQSKNDEILSVTHEDDENLNDFSQFYEEPFQAVPQSDDEEDSLFCEKLFHDIGMLTQIPREALSFDNLKSVYSK